MLPQLSGFRDHLFDFLRYYLVADQLSLTSLDAAMAIKTRPLARMPTKPMRMITPLNSNPKSNGSWPSVLTVDDDIDDVLSVVAD